MGDVLAWNPWAVPGIVAGVAALWSAAWIYRAGSSRRQNRLIALWLLLMAPFSLFVMGFRLLLVDPVHAYAMWSSSYIIGPGLSLCGVLIFGTFPTRLAGIFRQRRFVSAMAVYAVAASLAPAVWRGIRARGVAWAEPVGGWIATSLGPAWFLNVSIMAAIVGWGAICGFMSARRVRSGLEQRRLRMLGLGFAAFGLAFVVPLMILIAVVAFRASALVEAPWIVIMNFMFIPLAVAVLVGAFTYGVLSSHLFDIDLKLKFTLRRSTVAAVFVAVFVGVQTFVSELFTTTGGLAAGALAAASLVFLMTPLQRFADRLSNAAMPGVHDTEEYRTVRKQEVYRAAVEAAARDGEVTEKERDMLAALQDRLGLTAAAALAIERSATS